MDKNQGLTETDGHEFDHDELEKIQIRNVRNLGSKSFRRRFVTRGQIQETGIWCIFDPLKMH